MALSRRIRRFRLAGLALVATVFVLNLISAAATEEKPGPVYVIPVQKEIFKSSYAFIKRGVKEAEANGASAVVLDMNTPGGLVGAAVDIKDALLDTKLHIFAYIDREAISAGAFIAFCAHDIYMAEGGLIGAAAPILITDGEMKMAPEKIKSYLRGDFESVALARGHSEQLGKAMVDVDLELHWVEQEGKAGEILTKEELDELKDSLPKDAKLEKELIVAEGKLLTLSDKKAIKYGLAEGNVDSISEMLKECGYGGSKIISIEQTPSEVIVRFLTNPMVSGLLLMLGVLGIIFELKIPGWGVSGTIGVSCIIIFFSSHWLMGVANWFEILLFVIGIVLLGLEILVIPGFGIAGIAGMACILVSLYLAQVPFTLPDSSFTWQMEGAKNAIYTVATSMLCVIVAAFAAGYFLPKTPLWRHIAQVHTEEASAGYIGGNVPDVVEVGKRGVAYTPLRPAGRAFLEGDETLLDVVTRGDFINKGEPIKVIKIAGNRIVVAKDESQEA
ncbi:nodulation protein NfeD [Candidatus Hydrogenedentota bacterium]